MKIRLIISLLLVLIAQSAFGKKNIEYGLAFKSYEVEKENRTSLNLTPDNPMNLPDKFSLSFDVKLQRAHYIFGYIFRIVGKNNEHLDLLLSASKDVQMLPQLTVNQNNGEVLHNFVLGELGLGLNQWIHFEVSIDIREQTTRISINNQKYAYNGCFLKSGNDVRIYFGKNNDEDFQVSDIPIMTIKDIRIADGIGGLLAYWKLAQHVDNGVYDEVSRKFASCEYGKWLLDRNVFWEKQMTFTTKENPKICFNRDNNTLAVADKGYFYFYNIDEKNLKIDTVRAGFPSGSKSNDFFYDEVSQKYFSYNFKDEVAFYNPVKKIWSNHKENIDYPDYWHHNRYLSKSKGLYYTFNGYGFHLYKNEINRYDFATRTWSRQDTAKMQDRMAPRYLNGLGEISENRLLLFGGYGSESGDQELSPHNYYDLYEIDLDAGTQKKIWTLEDVGQNFVVANTMIVDNSEKYFYALGYSHQKFETKMQLYRFSMERPEYELLGDTILYQFNDINSYADLYISKDSTSLVAVVAYTDEKIGASTVSVYTLAFPPLKRADLFQSETESNLVWVCIIMAVIITVVIAGLILYRIRQKRKDAGFSYTVDRYDRSGGGDINNESAMPVVERLPVKRSILFFGGFQVTDKDGVNRTGDFTPILKRLFLLILLYTMKDGKGISSLKLKDYLWFDKTDESAKNNRGVSLSKLRTIFEQVGDISIVNKNSYWTVTFGEGIYCDYCKALALMERLSDKSIPFELKTLKRLLAIASVGELLPNIQTEWGDYFKTDFSNRFIDLSMDIATRSEYNLDYQTLVEITDAIFIHDPLNEDALKLKCSIFVKMGKNSLAKKIYTSFVNEYQVLFGTTFKEPFEQIISE